MTGSVGVNDKQALLIKAAQTFSPSAPVNQRTLFAGRIEQTKDVINAIGQRGQHIVLFGERGVGKTSLVNVIADMISPLVARLACGSINCDPTMNFSMLWHKVFQQLRYVLSKKTAGFSDEATMTLKNLDELLPEKVTPEDVRNILQGLGRTLIILDEVDRLKDKETKTLLADTIKSLSDHSTDTTIILVGVADSVDSLIEEHQSIERALVQIRMPRMSVLELFEIIQKGLQELGMSILQGQQERIALLSQGLPHYTHLLALHASQSAIERGSLEITANDVTAAIGVALRKTQQSILNAYLLAIHSSRENLYSKVLLACALTKTDKLGYFFAGDVREPLAKIMGQLYEIPAYSQHLNAFCDPTRGPILQKTGIKRRYRFRFINPLLQPYIIMQGIEEKLIDEADLKLFSA